ncbi:MAG: prolipoprotein diacylglyceryl transferase [Acidobacteriota bacterium]|nr:prolipoprotein diacylglyceryl transferase [Acidobacteriota bacterium]
MIVHHIDPVIGEAGGVYLWFYGLSYTLGFFEVFLWFRSQRRRLGFSMAEVYDISILLAGCVVLGGRTVEVIFYEWPYYSQHPAQIPWIWLGGMSTHGLLLGGAIGTAIFCRVHRRPFLTIADELVIPGAFLMGVGRIGNFIDGQIVGGVTSMPWGVKFPDADGFRHPVVIYDAIKNLLLVPVLIWIRRRNPKPGVVLANFIFWYAFLRIFVDVFREYPTRLFGLATGQSLNLFMSALGLVLWIWFAKYRGPSRTGRAKVPGEGRLWPRRVAFAVILALCLTMPSDWTQDVPKRYGKRHPALHYSKIYPPVSE